MVSTVKPDRVLLVRNPRFREWSHAAQPSGYPDRIVLLTPRGVSGPSSTVQGGADLTPVIGSLGSDERRLRTRYPGLLRVNSFAATDFWFLNVRAKPFRDVRVRRTELRGRPRPHRSAVGWSERRAADLPAPAAADPRFRTPLSVPRTGTKSESRSGSPVGPRIGDERDAGHGLDDARSPQRPRRGALRR